MASTGKVQEIASESSFKEAIAALPSQCLAVIYFHAPWAPPCKQMSVVLDTLASTYPASTPSTISFFSIHAEDVPEVSEEYDVQAVPFVVLQRAGKILESISGSDANKVREAIESHVAGGADGKSTQKVELPPAQAVTKPAESANWADGQPGPHADAAAEGPAGIGEDGELTEELRERLKELTNASPVMLFMKGTPSVPQCGFSRKTVGILREKSVRYGFFNILADLDVREGLKKFADWPTYPQLWMEGELVGGLDIIQEELEADPTFLDRFAVKTKKTEAQSESAAPAATAS